MDYYLQLRNLPYKRVVQPSHLPRPDLQRLGINYRRIPLVAIGRDIYCDTRLIIAKFETLFPDGALGARNAFERGVGRVLESWVIDAGPFQRAAGVLPTSSPLVQSEVWLKDRADGSGGKFTLKALKEGRPENLAHLRVYFDLIERDLLADGREYVFGTPQPSLGDVHAVWCFDWVTGLIQAAPQETGEDIFNEQAYPKVFAWVRRFRSAYKTAIQRNGEAKMLSSEEAIRRILASATFEKEGGVDEFDPLKLRKGEMVRVCQVISASRMRIRASVFPSHLTRLLWRRRCVVDRMGV